MDQAEVVIGLTDGGAGLEECLREVLGGVARRMVFILDFWHAAEHVVEFSQEWFPPEDPTRKPQVEAWCHTLKHQGGAALVQELRTLDLAAATPAAQKAHRQLLGYLERNQHRTDYPTYLANGWQIGSGVIESACKTVIGIRLKGAGMRWRAPGTNALAHLRALYRSDPTNWQTYWKRPVLF